MHFPFFFRTMDTKGSFQVIVMELYTRYGCRNRPLVTSTTIMIYSRIQENKSVLWIFCCRFNREVNLLQGDGFGHLLCKGRWGVVVELKGRRWWWWWWWWGGGGVLPGLRGTEISQKEQWCQRDITSCLCSWVSIIHRR